MTATEQNPLLAGPDIDATATQGLPEEDLKSQQGFLYRRLSPSQKRKIIALELKTTGSVINLKYVSSLSNPSVTLVRPPILPASFAVSLSLAGTSVGSLVWATYSGEYGRRFVYLLSLPPLCVGSAGVAFSRSVRGLLFWRVVQAFGASSAMSVGAAAIGGIYALEDRTPRNTPIAVPRPASSFGSAIAPLCGGLAAYYASWRYWGLFAMGLSAINPFGTSLTVLRSPNILLLTLAGTTALVTDFALSTPRYPYTLIGPFFIPTGIGDLLGAPIAGSLSDRSVIAWRKRRGGIWVPEDRLRASLLGAGFLVPMSMLLTELTIECVPGGLSSISSGCSWMASDSVCPTWYPTSINY
ncbi:major facilitator superfamily domain-containing protein [Daedaleopsis nitida]|nr:major facilitator superfamily domain-containing protein [Daedaleopsis nitida]